MSEDRGLRNSHIMVRMASEGIPTSAISRIIGVDHPTVLIALTDALRNEALKSLPPFDWPSGTRESAPALRIDMTEVNPLADKFCLKGFTPSEALMLAGLVIYGFVDRLSMHKLSSKSGSDPKVQDIILLRVRRKLDPYNIEIRTIWGRGHAMTDADRELAVALAKE